jgi:hypothetical protein
MGICKNCCQEACGGLQEQFSRTFSRKKSARQSEQLKVLGHAKPGTDDDMLPPLPPSSSSGSKQSAAASKGKKKEPSNLTKMLHSLEENQDSHEGFNLEIGDKNIKKNMPKG